MTHFFAQPELATTEVDPLYAHGLTTAFVISYPEPEAAFTLFHNLLLDQPLPEPALTALQQAYVQQVRSLQQELINDDALALPFLPCAEIEDSPMQQWCCGFMHHVFEHQTLWWSTALSEDSLSTLLLPIEVGSGLFAEEEEFRSLYADTDSLLSVVVHIPEVVIDLYLAFQAG